MFNIILLGFTSLCTDISSEMVYPLIPLFLTSLGAGPAALGLIEGKKAEVMKLVDDRTADVQKQLGAYQSLLNDKLALADAKKKELTDRLDKEKNGKVNDVLKGLFKK